MNDEQIGNSNQGPGAGDLGIDYGVYIPAGGLQGPAVTPFLNDSMSISEVSTQHSNNMADPMNPRLQKPTYADIAMQFQLGMAKIVCDFLSQWNKSLQVEADRVKEEINSPAYLAWQEQHSAKYLAEMDVKSGKDIVDPIKGSSDREAAITTGTLAEKDRLTGLQERYFQLTGLSNLLATTVQNMESARPTVSDPENSSVSLTSKSPGFDLSGYQAPQVMAASLAIGAGFISNFSQVPDVNSTSQVEVKTLQDAWNNINTNNDLITQNGGWFSAMWGIGLVYQLSAQNIAELGAGFQKGPHKDLEFAKGYAQTLLNSLDGNAFNISIMALLTPMLEKSPEGSSRQNPAEIALKGKLVLLAMAFALVYKLELKSKNPNAEINEETFAAMLKGNVDFSKNDEFDTGELKRQLVFHFNYLLQGLPDSEKVNVLEGILAYIGQKPDVEDLLDQQTVFSDVLAEGGTYEQSLVDKKPIGA